MATTTQRTELVEALGLWLGNTRIGILVHYSGGKNILTFDPSYIAISAKKPTITMTQLINPNYLSTPQIHSQRLPPLLSNLLPEGALRSWLAQSLKVHIDNEFPMLVATGKNLSGALTAETIKLGEIPKWALASREQVEPIPINLQDVAHKFSLAGVQMKFSSSRDDGRFNITTEDNFDNWIVKTPSTIHKHVPENEYAAMKLAQSIGVEIPDIELISLDSVSGIPDIQLPNEQHAYAIKRFDRDKDNRIHTEDFAQIFGLYAHDKYGTRNYEQIGAALHRYSSRGLADIQQFSRRLLANILLGNGDAHLKNWSVIYRDGINPTLSPAYDIVSTIAYVPGEKATALKMGKEKQWYNITMETFKTWAERIDVSWPAIKVHLEDAIELASERWPKQLENLPMNENHKEILKAHWTKLQLVN